jgi:hypothetical protein
MLKTRIIPCLDVKDGRVVKGVNFVDLRDAGDPVEQAAAYDAAGADELMFLDITASSEGRGLILDVIARTAEVCFMPLSVGGGIRGVEDARKLLRQQAPVANVAKRERTEPEVCNCGPIRRLALTLCDPSHLPTLQCYDKPSPGRILSPKDSLTLLQNATIELYWPDDGLWYRAEILSLNVRARSAKVLYSTGDIEQLSLDEVIQDGHLNVVRQ